MITEDFIKQQVLGTDRKAIQQINFSGDLETNISRAAETDSVSDIYFIYKRSKETNLKISLAKVL